MYTIYSKDNCIYCTRAKLFLNSREIEFDEYKLGTHFEIDFIKETYPSIRTFPVIVKDGILIGGYDSLVSTFE